MSIIEKSLALSKSKRRPRHARAHHEPQLLPRRRSFYPSVKRAVDILFALVFLTGTCPLILLLAVLIKLTSRGPAFYTQTRLGLGGRPFTVHKLRTMYHNCEDLSGPRWSIPGDLRITWLGRIL